MLNLVRLVRRLLIALGVLYMNVTVWGYVDTLGVFLLGAYHMPRAGAPTSLQYNGIYVYLDNLLPAASYTTVHACI